MRLALLFIPVCVFVFCLFFVSPCLVLSVASRGSVSLAVSSSSWERRFLYSHERYIVLIFHVCCISASGKMDLDGGMHGFTHASFMIMSVNNWPGLTLKLCPTHIQFGYVILVWLQLWLCLQWASIADALYSFWAKYRLPVTGVSLSFLSMYLKSFCQCG